MNKQPAIYDLEIDYENESTIEEIEQSGEYITSGQWLSDLVAKAQSLPASHIRSTICIVPCDGWCHDTNKTTQLLREVGNDKAKTRGYHLDHINKALKTECRACADRHFKLADALSYHLDFLESRERRDNKGVVRAVARRGELLRQLGYTLA